MIWSRLTPDEQTTILAKIASGEAKADVAGAYGLNPESLSRKLRLLAETKRERVFGQKWLNIEIDKPTRVMLYSDAHFGNEDPLAVAAALIVAREFQPEIIFNLGDTLDGHGASRFKKDPHAPVIQVERDRWFMWAEELNYICPDAKKYIIQGNHDERFTSLVSEVKGLADIDELSLDSMLFTEELGYHPIVDVIAINPSGDELYPQALLYLMHGEKTSQNAGQSVKAMSDMFVGANLAMGHAHRSAMTTRRSERGILRGYEIGTLMSLRPDYSLFPNWIQGVSTGIISRDFFDLQLHVIDRGRVCVNGKMFRAEE